MGRLQMSQKERDRLQMVGQVNDGQMTLTEASERLRLSDRQTRRLRPEEGTRAGEEDASNLGRALCLRAKEGERGSR